MQIGFDIRIPQAISDADTLVKTAVQGEALGFDYITLGDHLVTPIATESDFPYSSDGKLGTAAVGSRHEMLSTIAFLAAKTSTLRFVAGVMVVPYRPAVLAAKTIATIDVLSEGRVTVGVGTGWMREEFEVLSAPDFKDRGRVTDEYIDAMTALWSQDSPGFSGNHIEISGISALEPKVIQTPRPPIWVGGMGKLALKRVARRGDCWYTVPSDAARPMDTLPRVQQGIADLRQAVEEEGRDPNSVAMAMRVLQYGQSLPDSASDDQRMLFSGELSEISEDLEELRNLGISAIDFCFHGESSEEVVDAMGSFQNAVAASH